MSCSSLLEIFLESSLVLPDILITDELIWGASQIAFASPERPCFLAL